MSTLPKNKNSSSISCALVLAVLLLNPVAASAARLTFTFDDGPRPDTFLTGMDRTKRLISALQEGGVSQAAIYCNLREDAKDRMERLKMYSDAGVVLANHTASHFSIDSVPIQEYIADIAKADKVLSQFATFRKWFRYPYRRESSGTDHDLVKAYLKKSGYKIGYSTVENMDWVINDDLQEALSKAAAKNPDMNVVMKDPEVVRLKERYIQVTRDSVAFYDQMGVQALGYSPVHVLLMHEMDINALFLPDVLKALRADGHTFVPAGVAFLDQIADPKWDSIPGTTLRLQTIVESTNMGTEPASTSGSVAVPPHHYTGDLYSKWMSYYNGPHSN